MAIRLSPYLPPQLGWALPQANRPGSICLSSKGCIWFVYRGGGHVPLIWLATLVLVWGVKKPLVAVWQTKASPSRHWQRLAMPRWCSCTSPYYPLLLLHSTTTTSSPHALSKTPHCNFYSPSHHSAPHHHTVEVVFSPKHHAGNAPEITALHQTHKYTKHRTSSEISILQQQKHLILSKLTTVYEHYRVACMQPLFISASLKARSRIKPEVKWKS